MRRHVRQLRVDRIALGLAAHEALDQPVLERMEADHAQPAARREQADGLRQRGLDFLELAIHVDADRLEGARRRMLAGFARRHRAGHDVGKLPRGADRRRGARGHDGACDAPREFFFAELEQHVRNLPLARAR